MDASSGGWTKMKRHWLITWCSWGFSLLIYYERGWKFDKKKLTGDINFEKPRFNAPEISNFEENLKFFKTKKTLEKNLNK